MRAPTRIDGYAPIADYAAIGDGRSLGLVALDGAIDWLCLPTLDSPPVLAALLDPGRGGSFVLRPKDAFIADRRYSDDSNVLETVYTTASGTVKVVDAFLTEGGALLPWTEIVRKVEAISGSVELEWRLGARPRWGREEVHVERRDDVALVEWDSDAIAVISYGCGKPTVDGADVHGSFSVGEQESALLAALYFDDAPHAIPPRGELEVRLERTREYWETYTRQIPYDGPWRAAVRRSVLTQRLLTYAPSGAIAAAATTSLPERIGGDRNWDYRFSWVRDTSLALESLLAVRLTVECQRSLAWVVNASRRQDELQPMYTLETEPELPREDIDFFGYRGSRPVRVGNDAQDQLQLGGYADILDAAFRFCRHGHALDAMTAQRCCELANDVCELWRRDDAGIWEIEPKPYTHSKIACWTALDRAIELADDGRLPGGDVKRWRSSRDEIREWVEQHCWSAERNAYVAYPGTTNLDASLLLSARSHYFDEDFGRLDATVEALRSELGRGPFLYRTSALADEEGCFLPCSFWLVDTLARRGRVDEARSLMDELLAAGNDVGLYSEQIDPSSREQLGNFPQALTHLSLILAAVSVMRAERSLAS